MKLFVYGTLMRGEPAHDLLGGAPFLGEARTEPAYTLLDLGTYPALVRGGSTSVRGELYEIDASSLPELDRYEEAPEIYERVTLSIGGEPAIAYVLRPEHGHQGRALAHGDWRRRIPQRR